MRFNRGRSELQTMVLSAPIGYQAPIGESHSEYPKYIHLPKKIDVIVNSREEENAVLAGAQIQRKERPTIEHDAPVPTLVGRNDERQMLLAIAEKRGIHVDMRWKTPKLRRVLENACYTGTESSWL